MADSPEQVLHLEGVLGCTTAPNAVHAVDPETVFYLAGNVGVLYHVPSKTQTLLRGHRNPVRACCISSDRKLLVTACAGSDSSVIIWGSGGSPLAVLEGAHSAGTQAVDISEDGRFLVTLSAQHALDGGADPAAAGSGAGASSSSRSGGRSRRSRSGRRGKGTAGGGASGGDAGAALVQEVAVWAIPSGVRRAAAREAEEDADLMGTGEEAAGASGGDSDTTLALVATSIVPVTDAQHSVVFNHAPLARDVAGVVTGSSSEEEDDRSGISGGTPRGGGIGSAWRPPTRGGGTLGGTGGSGIGGVSGSGGGCLQLCYELATTGAHSVLFWTMLAGGVVATAAAASSTAAGTLGAAAARSALAGSLAAAAGASRPGDATTGGGAPVVVTSWQLLCRPAPVPGARAVSPLEATALLARMGVGAGAALPGAAGAAGGGDRFGAASASTALAGGSGAGLPSASTGNAPTLAGPVTRAVRSVAAAHAVAAAAAGGGIVASSAADGTGSGRVCTGTVFLPHWSASGTLLVSAVTGTTDGTLVLWSSGVDTGTGNGSGTGSALGSLDAGVPPPAAQVAALLPAYVRLREVAEAAAAAAAAAASSSSAQPSPPVAGYSPHALSALAHRLLDRSPAKMVRLTKPTHVTATSGAAGGGAAAAAAVDPSAASDAANVLLPSPCGRYICVGGEDGTLRCYDVSLRLVAWWEQLDAGPVTSLTWVPIRGAGARGRGGAALADAAAAAAAASASGGRLAVPDFVIGTRRSMLLHLASSSFAAAVGEGGAAGGGGAPVGDDHDADARRGTILLEGPDAPVVGVAAYPHPYAHLLAVVVASGTVQLWDMGDPGAGAAAATAGSRRLLVVRELQRHHGHAAGSAAAAAAALQPPTYLHPTVVSVDKYARFLAVGTVEGFVCILDPLTLGDAQPPIPPPHVHVPYTASNDAAGTASIGGPNPGTTGSGGMGGYSAVVGGLGSQGAAGGRTTSGGGGAPVVCCSFADDGIHLAVADADRHVALWRYTRTITRQVAPSKAPASSSSPSSPGLGGGGLDIGSRSVREMAALLLGRRTLKPTQQQQATSARSRRRHGGDGSPIGPGASVFLASPDAAAPPTRAKTRPWQLLDASASGPPVEFEEIASDAWAYVGRVRSHAVGVVSIAFSPLLLDVTAAAAAGASGDAQASSRALAASLGLPPHVYAVTQLPALAPGGTGELSVALRGGYEGPPGSRAGGVDVASGEATPGFWPPDLRIATGSGGDGGGGALSRALGGGRASGLAAGTATLLGRHWAAGICMLSSVGHDRRLVLYDIGASSAATGLVVAACNPQPGGTMGGGGATSRPATHPYRHLIHHSAKPTAALWYPGCTGNDAGTYPPLPDTESSHEASSACLLVADDEFKVRALRTCDPTPAPAPAAAASGGKAAGGGSGVACRQTVLGPTSGGCITHLHHLLYEPPAHSGAGDVAGTSVPPHHFLAYGTAGRVVGVMALPLAGNPQAAVSVVAHPGPITGVTVAAGGHRLYTCGLDDGTALAGAASAAAPGTAGAAAGSVAAPVPPNVVIAKAVAAAAAAAIAAATSGGDGSTSAGDVTLPAGSSGVSASAATAARASSGNGTVCLWAFDGRRLNKQVHDSTAGVLAAASAAATRARLSPAEASARRVQAALAPYLSLLGEHVDPDADAGSGSSSGSGSGSVFDALVDVFAYAHIRSQGEDTTETRATDGSLPMGELPSVMRALGFFPTGAETAALLEEGTALMARRHAWQSHWRAHHHEPTTTTAAAAAAAGDAAASGDGSAWGVVDLPTVVRLFANHRPVTGGPSGSGATGDVLQALATISTHIRMRQRAEEEAISGARGGGGGNSASSGGGDTLALGRGRSAGGGRATSAGTTGSVASGGGGRDTIEWGALSRLLQSRGERMTQAEIRTCLTALMGAPADGEEDADEAVLGGGADLGDHFAEYSELHPVQDIAVRILGLEVPGAGGETAAAAAAGVVGSA